MANDNDTISINTGDLDIDSLWTAPSTLTDDFSYTMSSEPLTITTGGSDTITISSGIDYSDTITLTDPIWNDATSKSLKSNQIEMDDGRTLSEALASIEERLNILVPNKELEAEWEELRQLGEQYRELEKRCADKSKVWEKLVSLPKIDID